MDFDSFNSKWQGLDPQETWTSPPPELLSDYQQLHVQEVVTGDVVFTLAESTWQLGLGTGNENSSQVEILEHHNNSSRTRYIDKSSIVGVFRPKNAPVVLPPEPPKEHQYAMAPVTTALHIQRILVKVDLDTYGDPGHAVRRENPLPKKLPQGMQEFDLLKLGMLRVAGTTSWVNPADNVIKPKLLERKDTRHDYKWYEEPIKYKADRGYMQNHPIGEVFSFVSDKPNAKIRHNQPVYIAGTFVDGEQLYGVPANPQPNGEFNRVLNFGILMSYLSLDQLDYVPEEDLISDVTPPEAAALVPRQVSVKDNITLIKAHGIKLIDGFIKRR